MKYYQGMGIFTPGEQRNTEYLELKYSSSTPETSVSLCYGKAVNLKHM